MLEITTSEDGTIRLRGRFDASQVGGATAAFDRVRDSCTVDCAETGVALVSASPELRELSSYLLGGIPPSAIRRLSFFLRI